MASPGIVTFLFTDLVGSTALLDQLGEEAADGLRRDHFHVLRDLVAGAGGREIKSLGDGMMVAFASPAAALRCAAGIQRAVAARHDGLVVRIGVHVGEPIPDEDEQDYFGSPVVVAKRLCNDADGGQVLLSDVVLQLVGARAEFRFEELGERTLRGLQARIRIHELVVDRDARSAQLLEREQQLAQIRKSIQEIRSGAGGAVIVVEGVAGIGKTSLLRATGELGQASGIAVLAARGSELEQEFAYGVARQLLEPPLASASARTRKLLLAGAAGLAGDLLHVAPATDAGEAAPGPAAAERLFAAMHGMYWVCANLANSGPMLLLVDDAHWADVASLRFLTYLAARLEQHPILVVLAMRPAEPGAEPGLLSTITAGSRANLVRLQPLSRTAVGAHVRESLAHEAAEEFCLACHSATAGNPFLLSELLGELRAEHVIPTAPNARRVGELAPETVARTVLMRLRRLPPGAAAMAGAVAVLGTDAEVRHASTLSELDEHAAATVVDALTDVDIFRPGRPLEFVHPLVRSAVYEDLPPAQRALSHARAARLLAEDGAPADAVASQLLASEPAADGWVVDRLREAARQALARGAPEAAIAHLRRALSEPPATGTRASVLLELGKAEYLTRPGEAVAHLQAAVEASPHQRERFEAWRELWRVLIDRFERDEAIHALDNAIQEIQDADRDLAMEVEGELLATGQVTDVLSASAVAERLSRHREELAGATPGERAMLAAMAFEAGRTNRSVSLAGDLAERALGGGKLLPDRPGDSMAFYAAGVALVYACRLELAESCYAQAVADARARGAVFAFAGVSSFRCWCAYRRGALAEAEEHARGAIEAEGPQGEIAPPAGVGFLIEALIERGELAAAEQALVRVGLADTPPDQLAALGTIVPNTRGLLRIAEGKTREGLEDLLACARHSEALGFISPCNTQWRSSAALAYATLGDHEKARELAIEELELSRQYGAPLYLGISLRAAGLIVRGMEGLKLLHEAVGALEDSPGMLELARALTDLGAALRRAGERHKAREPLSRALDLAHRCGATVLGQRALTELKAAGARPRHVVRTGLDSLTASERRVATMAADGLTNSEIAQALFVTNRTIETHLTHVYQKLGIRSRGEVVDQLDRHQTAELQKVSRGVG